MRPCIELTDTELEDATLFLAKYVEDHPVENPDNVNDPDSCSNVRVRPNCFYMTKEELEGEVLELVTTYLSRRNCFSALKSSLAHQVAVEMLASDLSVYEQEHKLEEDADIQYDAMKVSRGVFVKLSEVCRKWNTNMPKIFKNCIDYFISFDAIQNTRRKMEDKHVIIPDFNSLHGIPLTEPSRAFFAVFDGHGGIDGACYASSQLHCLLKVDEKLSEEPLEALKQAFLKTDEKFVKKGKREKLRSGSTGVAVLLQENKLYIAWVGDSQSILVRDGTSVELMQPHTPNRQDERERIEKLGGCVVWFGGWRVNGCLAVSRAIGDYEQKPYVSGEPDTAQFDLEGNEDVLILACDGLWDTLTFDDAAKFTINHIKDEDSKMTVARALIEEAKARGSTDNITCMVIFLDGHKITKDITVIGQESETEKADNATAPKVAKEDNETKNIDSKGGEPSTEGGSTTSVPQ